MTELDRLVREAEIPPLLTRRQYLVLSSIQRGNPLWLAMEAVATTALAHPEWDMSEQLSWTEWEATA